MDTLDLSEIEDWTATVLRRSGLRESDAHWVAKNLGFAELRGVSTHGLVRLPLYIERILNGGINKSATPSVVHDLGALVIVDADDGPGAASGVFASDIAVERARRLGIGCVVARNANHFGASAFFTNRIADADLVGIAVCNTESVMCAPFGGRPVLGTNPLAVAVPMETRVRPQLDMATTTTSQGRLILAEQAGRPIPLGWAVDAMGHPTESATEGLGGALLPSGGPKGFGIAFAIDAILAISGANTSPYVGALGGDPRQPQKLGHAFIALRADVAAPLEDYRGKIASLVDAIHQSGIVGQEHPPVAPGEPETAKANEAGDRIQLRSAVMAELAHLAERMSVPLPAPLTRAN